MTRRREMSTKTRNITFLPSGTSRARSTRGLLAAAVCGLLISLTAPAAQACIQVGGCDGFGVGGTLPTVQRADFKTWLKTYANVFCNGPGNTLPFDEVNDADCSFGYSLEQSSELYDFCCSADPNQRLRIHLKAGTSLPSTDGLALVFNNLTQTFAWSISLPALDASGLCTHLVGAQGGGWNANEDMECVLDLCNLPPDANGTTNLQSAIRARGAVDVYIQDDTGVDCIDLCYDRCFKQGVPALSAWGLGALALLLLSAVAIKFGRRRVVQV